MNPLLLKRWMFPWIAVALVAAAARVAHAQPIALPAAALVDGDFSTADVPVHIVAEDGDHIVGVLPRNWQDRSGYQKGAKIRYEVVEVDGRKGLRVTKIAGGEVQLFHPLPDVLPPGALYRLTVTGRNPQQMVIKMGVRDNAPPWTSYATKTPALGDEWQTWTADFTLSKDRRPSGFYIFASGNGAFDLARVTLSQRTPEAMLAEARAKYPDGGPKNLLRHTRFPLGLQSGWALESKHSLGEEVFIEADPLQTGPSGAPTLHVRSDGRTAVLFSAPFDAARLLDRHTASFYVRGEGSGRLQVRRGYHESLATQNFTVVPGDGWKRVTASFEPGVGASLWALRWELKGDVHLDALQVEPSATATGYASQQPLEVALAPTAGDVSLVRIHFDDETPAARYVVTGPLPPAAVLRARVVDAFNKIRDLPRVKLASPTRQGTLRYDAFSGQRFGAFRIEGRVEDPSGKPLSPWNELVMTRLRRPRYWGKDAPNSPFGIHLDPTQQDILIAKASGANWTRLHDAGSLLMKWAYVEPEKGQWRWRDDGIQRFRSAHIKILGVLQTTPKWASVGQQGGMGYFDQYFLPANPEDWKNYVRAVATRYKGIVDTYDVWNEPWGGGYLSVGRNASGDGRGSFIKPQDPIGAYLALQRAAFEVVRQTDPNARVLVDTTFADWTQRTLAEEKAQARLADVIAFHSYPSALLGWPTDGVSGGMKNKIALVKDSLDPARPLWMTEGSPVNDRLFSGIYHHTLPYKSEENVVDTSNRVARFLLTLLGSGVERMFLYSQGKTAHFGKETLRWAVNVMEDGYPHPSAAAHSALAYLLEDTRHVKTLEVADGVFAYLFEGSGRAVAALTTKPGHKAYRLPAAPGLQTLDLFGNPAPAGPQIKNEVLYLSLQGNAGVLEKLLGDKGR